MTLPGFRETPVSTSMTAGRSVFLRSAVLVGLGVTIVGALLLTGNIAQAQDDEFSEPVAPAAPTPRPTRQSPSSSGTGTGGSNAGAQRPVSATTKLLEAIAGKSIYQTWDASEKKYGIGLFQGSTPAGLLFEHWVRPKFGYEVMFGYQKSEGSYSLTTANSENITGTSRTSTDTNSGTRAPGVLLMGAAANYAIYQSEWIRIKTAFHAHLRYQMAAEYAVGSKSVTVANTAAPSDFSVSESGLGTTSIASTYYYSLGPAIGADVFLRWFPNLSIGFYSLVLWNSERAVDTTTTTRTRTYTVVGGVEQPASSDTTTTSTTKVQPGSSGATSSLGGAQFNLFGSFTVRYVW